MASSVSKGVFAFKGKKKQANPAEYYSKDASSFDSERQGISLDLWDYISQKIQTLQSGLNAKIFEELVQFVEVAHKDFNMSETVNGGKPEIPTAALVTGVNMPDHDLMFGNLTSMLTENVTPYVTVLESKDCPNIKSVMSKIITRFMKNSDLDIEDEDDEDNKISMRQVSCTMPVLSTWYCNRCKKTNSPHKKNVHYKLEFPPLVIMLEDMEAFSPHVLQDFISICSNHLHHLPLVLVFGIATTVRTVHKLLPHAVSSLLCMEKFQAPPSAEYLGHVINEVVMTADSPFKLGSRVFKLLLDLFLYHDFSVVSFIRGLQFCLLEHYQSDSTSVLCQPLTNALDCVKTMKHKNILLLREKPSYQRYVEKCRSDERIKLLQDENYTKKEISKMLEVLDNYHQTYFPVLECLHILVGKLPGYPLGKQLREVYCLSLSSSVCDTEEGKQAFNMLRTMSRDELSDLIIRCIQTLLRHNFTEEFKEVTTHLESLIERFRAITDVNQMAEMEEPESAPAVLPKKMHELRETLRDMERRKKRHTVYELLRNETIDYFQELFRKYLKCPKDLPLHEVIYFDNINKVKEHIIGSPRAALHTALNNPFFYLQNENLICDGMTWESLPDVCIVYKLHLECGKMINLYDWLQAFVTVVESNDEGKKKKQNKPNTVMQARFIRAVSELQFLGFIKPTKRKTDHVARLTWGGC